MRKGLSTANAVDIGIIYIIFVVALVVGLSTANAVDIGIMRSIKNQIRFVSQYR